MKTLTQSCLFLTLFLGGCSQSEYTLFYLLENTTDEAVQVTARRLLSDEDLTIEVPANTCSTFLTDELTALQVRSFAETGEDTIVVNKVEFIQNGNPFIGNEKQFDKWVIKDEKVQSTFVITVTEDDF